MAGQQPLRRKRIALGPSEPTTDKEKAFSDVLASISRAQHERLALKREFDKQNTLKYCILEAGAETFELSRIYVYRIINTFSLWRTILLRYIPVPRVTLKGLVQWLPERLASQTLAAIVVQPILSQSDAEDPRISELKSELMKLREEMKSFTAGALAEKQLEPSLTQVRSRHQTETGKFEAEFRTSVQKRPVPLPFNAEMLISAKNQQRTPNKAAATIPKASSRISLKPRSPTMQEVLQRALEEKFKNVRCQYNDDLDTSFDNEFRSAKDEEVENVVRKPPVPPRPKSLKTGSGVVPPVKRKALGAQN